MTASAERERASSKVLSWVRCAASDGIPLRAFYVALIVGTILNLINQGDALLGHSPVNVAKLLLTYCVPYFVCTYGAVSYKMQVMSGAGEANG
jgi:hypothetical protein